MLNITQEEVNSAVEKAKAKWNSKVKESGQSEHMFIILDRTGFAMNFLSDYQVIKEKVEELGLVMPELIKGIKVSFRDLSEN
jgi:hypothetical protein